MNVFILLTLLCLLENLSKCESSESVAVNYADLLYLFPKNSDSEYVLNEKNSFTNRLSTGWIFKANTQMSILAYILVQEQVYDFDDSRLYGLIYFTTNPSSCDINTTISTVNLIAKQKSVYELKFNKERSKLYKNSPRVTRSLQLRPTDTNSTIIVADLSINLNHQADKYYSCLHLSKKSEDTDESNELLTFVHQGTRSSLTQIITTKELLPIYLVIVFYLVLLMFSALFSGLNLGLMSLDLRELSLLKKSGTRREKSYAKKIYPLRKRGNQLLCTILLGNVLVNSTSTLILGNYIDGMFAAIGSTLLIVVFGEIIPQAVCSRYGLAVGAHTRYITYSVMGLTFPISYPLAKILDFFLGKEIAASYSRENLRELMRKAADEQQIQKTQFNLIAGALDFKNKYVKDTMVHVKDVFSLDINSILDFDTFKSILYHGYSRIPVYEHTKENFVGLIMIQDLLLHDPADKVPLKAVMDYYKHPVPRCKLDDKLEFMFDKLRKGDSHLAFVYEKENFERISDENEIVEALGIVTLENIIEALVQGDIMDEADTKRERRKKRAKELLKGKLANLSLSTDNLNIFVTDDIDDSNKPVISPQIKKALFYFLASSVKPFTCEFISPKVLETFLKQPDLLRERRNLSEIDGVYLYKYGVEADYFIVVLDGSATVEVGADGIEINAGLFSYYGVNALMEGHETSPEQIIANENDMKPYKPEFSLKVNSHCVYLKITRKEWKDAIKKSLLERNYLSTNHNVNNGDIKIKI